MIRTGLLTKARRVARAIRHTPDRLLHPVRRLRARRVIADRAASVLFICYGNICRSPYAAVAFARLAENDMRVASAGFIGPGRPSPPEARTVAVARGIDLSEHVSQLVTGPLLSEYDVLVVMSADQRKELAGRFGRTAGVLLLGDLDPHPIDMRTIRDPFDQTEEVFREVYDRIDRCLAELWQLLRAAEAGPGQPGGVAA
jgi:protein-tyrosine-phosphatase